MCIENLPLINVWDEIDRVAKANEEIIQSVNGLFVFEIKTDRDEAYSLQLEDGTATIFPNRAENAQCTLTMNEKNFKKLLLGDLNATAAFMTGRLKVKGDISLALKLEGMLTKLPFKEGI